MAREDYLNWDLDKTFDDVTDDEIEQALAYVRRRKWELIDAQNFDHAARMRDEERRFLQALGGQGLIAIRPENDDV